MQRNVSRHTCITNEVQHTCKLRKIYLYDSNNEYFWPNYAAETNKTVVLTTFSNKEMRLAQ